MGLATFTIEKVLSENLSSIEVKSDTLYLVKDNNKVKLYATGGIELIPVSESTDIPTFLGTNFVFESYPFSLAMSNYDSDKEYVVSADRGTIEVTRDRKNFGLIYICDEAGPDTIHVNGRSIQINVLPKVQIDPVVLEFVSGTESELNDPYILRVPVVNTSIPLKPVMLNLVVSQKSDFSDPNVITTSQLPPFDLNLSQQLGSFFQPNSTYYIKTTYFFEHEESGYSFSSEPYIQQFRTGTLAYPIDVFNRLVYEPYEDSKYRGKCSASSADLKWLAISEQDSSQEYHNLIIKIFERINEQYVQNNHINISLNIPNDGYGVSVDLGKEITSMAMDELGNTLIVATLNAGLHILINENGSWIVKDLIDVRGSAEGVTNGCFISKDGNTVAFSVIAKYVISPADGLLNSFVHVYKKVNDVWTEFQVLSQPTRTGPFSYTGGYFIEKNGVYYPQSYFGEAIQISDNSIDMFIGAPSYNFYADNEKNYNTGVVYHYKLDSQTNQYIQDKVIENPNPDPYGNNRSSSVYEYFGCTLKLSSSSETLVIGSDMGLFIYRYKNNVIVTNELHLQEGSHFNFGHVFWLSGNGEKLYVTSSEWNGGQGALLCYMRDSVGIYQNKSLINNYTIPYLHIGYSVHGDDNSSKTLVCSPNDRIYITETNSNIYNSGTLIEYR